MLIGRLNYIFKMLIRRLRASLTVQSSQFWTCMAIGMNIGIKGKNIVIIGMNIGIIGMNIGIIGMNIGIIGVIYV